MTPRPAPTANSPAPSASNHAASRPTADRSLTPSPSATARPAAGTFSPLRPVLGLDGHGYSPNLLQQIVELAARLSSFEQAAIALRITRRLDISGRHINRLAEEVGNDLARQRDEQAAQHRRRQLQPRVAEPPPVAVVEVDGGRLRTRQPDAGPGVHQVKVKEDKVACLLSMRSDTHAQDPQPEPPPAFRDAPRVQRLVRRLKAAAASETDLPEESPEANATASAENPARPGAPVGLVRTCVASLQKSRAFGPMVAAEAQTRNFYRASRQAFVADGLRYNWRIQRVYFPHFEPIADFIHVLCYLYLAARAVCPDEASGWQQYEGWMAACWQGRVAAVIEEMTAWQERLGRPPPEADAQDPRRVLWESLRYLRNNASRMDYPRYRCAGLPVTSSLVESLVGEFNERVKGKDKYWNRPEGAEAILQVRAAVLSEDDRLGRYFASRPGRLYRRHASAK